MPSSAGGSHGEHRTDFQSDAGSEKRSDRRTRAGARGARALGLSSWFVHVHALIRRWPAQIWMRGAIFQQERERRRAGPRPRVTPLSVDDRLGPEVAEGARHRVAAVAFLPQRRGRVAPRASAAVTTTREYCPTMCAT